MGHALMENRNGFVVEADAHPGGRQGRTEAALDMIDRARSGLDAPASRSAPTRATTRRTSSTSCADMCVTPHVAAKANGSAIDGRTTRHAGYAVSQSNRKLIEEPFGWGKTVGPIAQTMLRGLERVCAQFTFHGRLQSRPAAQTAGRLTPKRPPPSTPRLRSPSSRGYGFPTRQTFSGTC